MISARPLPFHALLACAGVLFCTTAVAAPSKLDRDIQLLANFPALQKVAVGEKGAGRAFVKRVTVAYTRAGYHAFGLEFRRSGGEIIARFTPNADEESLKNARAALRRLQLALKKDDLLVLPANAGEKLPDY
jgi:hypothetical protein